MRAEDISKAIGQLDEEIILPVQKERERVRKMNRPVWITAAAIAASIGIVGGAAALMKLNIGEKPPVQTAVSGSGTASAAPAVRELAAAAYPACSPYPDENSDDFDEAYDLWLESEKERYDAKNKIRNAEFYDFCQRTVKEFLSGAGGENRVYSPVNVYVALAMLAEITDGDSRAQILELLGEESMEKLRSQAKNIWRANYQNDGATAFISANSVWLNDTVLYNEETLNTLAERYFASSYSGDPASEEMNALLREWLNVQTGGLLEQAAENIALDPATVIALCSTVYFSAKWSTEFSENKNDVKIFHSPDGDIEAQFMNASLDHFYYRGENCGAVSLSFAEGGSMWLILPDEDSSVDEVLASGEYMSMVRKGHEWPGASYLGIDLSVPKFDVSCETDMTDILKKLGVTDVFDSGRSDFTPLTDFADGLAVNTAKHAARVMIDEKGCKAAAFTVMSVAGAIGVEDTDRVEFILDRPFIFVIRGGAGQSLFTGVVNRP